MSTIATDARPRLARGVRLSEDRVRGGWNLLAPERVLRINKVGVEVLSLCDGNRDFEAIVAELAARFDADRARIAGDAGALIADLAQKRMVDL